jgi:hypothetical protein
MTSAPFVDVAQKATSTPLFSYRSAGWQKPDHLIRLDAILDCDPFHSEVTEKSYNVGRNYGTSTVCAHVAINTSHVCKLLT